MNVLPGVILLGASFVIAAFVAGVLYAYALAKSVAVPEDSRREPDIPARQTRLANMQQDIPARPARLRIGQSVSRRNGNGNRVAAFAVDHDEEPPRCA